ncbi:unnamed protein product [Schistosoma mattheei]|uniref:Uncharacterized protein n=1 Tax=Schistosoma mattheei TaxID=31246 RepID=A0A183NLF1_9TREM|nr:unnamed protein product [Schistosoma mattheei]
MHIAEDASGHRSSESFSAFPFKSCTRKIRSSVRCWFAAAKQAAQRYAEGVYFQSLLDQDVADNLTEPERLGIDFQHQSGQYILVNDTGKKQVFRIPEKWLLDNDHFIYRDDVTATDIIDIVDCDSRFTLRKCMVLDRCGKL